MSEAPSVDMRADRERLRDQLNEHYDLGAGYALRWMFYDFTDDGINFHDEIVHQLELEGHELQGEERILDVGCGQAMFLKGIRQNGHTGQLVGMDVSKGLATANKPGISHLVRADATCDSETNRGLPFLDNQFDVVTALFMLYHVDDPQETIQEMQRVIAPEGRVIIATSGADNKRQHREHELLIANELKALAPPIYAETFDISKADELLPDMFGGVYKWEQQTTVTITSEHFMKDVVDKYGPVNAYIQSLKSTHHLYEPITANGQKEGFDSDELNAPIRDLVMKDIKRQIEKDGAFVETIHRKLYICSDPR